MTGRDDATLRRYREASAALDERPSADARASILAAAARQVQARPQSADAPRPRRRWPAAAAATVLLSTLAVMMATRTEQEMPTFTAPAGTPPEQRPAVDDRSTASGADAKAVAEPAPESRVAAPPDAGMGAARAGKPPVEESQAFAGAESAGAREAAPGQLQKRIAEPKASPPPAAEQPHVRRNETPAATANGTIARTPPSVAARSAEAPQAFPAAPAAPGPAPAPPPAPAAAIPPAAPGDGAPVQAAKPAAPRMDERALRDAAPSSAPRAMREEAASGEGRRRQGAAAEPDGSPQAWLERIVKLRVEGRHTEADAELKRFRERHPDVQVPPAALPPTGTR